MYISTKFSEFRTLSHKILIVQVFFDRTSGQKKLSDESMSSGDENNYFSHREDDPATRKKGTEFECKLCGRIYYTQKGLDKHIARHGKYKLCLSL